MIKMEQNKLDFDMMNKQIRTLYIVYAGRHKQQTTNLFKIPAGSEGKIRLCYTEHEYNIKYYLVIFYIDNTKYYCKISENMLEFI